MSRTSGITGRTLNNRVPIYGRTIMRKFISVLLAVIILSSIAAFATADFNGIVITKNPTDEEVWCGEPATFVAKASNYDSMSWKIVSPDGGSSVDAVNAGDHFEGVYVSGSGSNALTIHNISDTMNGWRVIAVFNGEGGPVSSEAATITVHGDRSSYPANIELATMFRQYWFMQHPNCPYPPCGKGCRK